MTLLNRLNFLLLTGIATGVTTVFVAPNSTGAALAFVGGVIGGSSLVSERSTRKEVKEKESQDVVNVFAALYEKNNGLIDPVELAFLSRTSVDKAHAFLENLAEVNNGSKIPLPNGFGVAFNFPHVSSVLDELTKNAQGWAVAQNQKLSEELAQTRASFNILRLQNASRQTNGTAPVQQDPDPWNNQQNPYVQ